MRSAKTRSAHHGFTLTELLVSVALLLVVMAGMSGLYIANQSARSSEDVSQTVEAQLRTGMDSIMFDLRSAGYGVPLTNISAWTPWVTDATWAANSTSDPVVLAGATSSDPDKIWIALAGSQPIGTFAADFNALTCPAAPAPCPFTIDTSGAAVLSTMTSATVPKVDLLFINDFEPALVYAKSGTSVTPDTSPNVAGPQDLSKSYGTGTPIYRVDVVTFSVDAGAKQLLRNDNRGAGAQVVVDGISNMKIITDATGAKPKYTVTLTATASQFDRLSNSTTPFTRSLTSTASRRNCSTAPPCP